MINKIIYAILSSIILLLLFYIILVPDLHVCSDTIINDTIILETIINDTVIINDTIIINDTVECNDTVINNITITNINESMLNSERLKYIKKIQLLERRNKEYLDDNETGYFINLTDSYKKMKNNYADCLKKLDNSTCFYER